MKDKDNGMGRKKGKVGERGQKRKSLIYLKFFPHPISLPFVFVQTILLIKKKRKKKKNNQRMKEKNFCGGIFPSFFFNRF